MPLNARVVNVPTLLCSEFLSHAILIKRDKYLSFIVISVHIVRFKVVRVLS